MSPVLLVSLLRAHAYFAAWRNSILPDACPYRRTEDNHAAEHYDDIIENDTIFTTMKMRIAVC
jgi:hypothetical protein